MRSVRLLLTTGFIWVACSPVLAVEGPTIAGPIGGTDIRSAQLPPPGLYGGVILGRGVAFDFVDGNGKTISELSTAHLTKTLDGPFLMYVPDVKVLGGSIGLAGIIPNGLQCGHLIANTPDDCTIGLGDPYIEIAWSRSFGKLRPSKFPGAFPIFEGLSILVGFGAVLPIGQYDASNPTAQALSLGGNIWDFAPSVAFTYTTRPILAEGTEFSAKLYWNNYLPNPTTDYSTGDLMNIDFAVSERIGRFQLGLAGVYVLQVEDDKQFGVKVPPDGRRVELLELGGVINYDMPEHKAALRAKVLTTAMAKNLVRSYTIIVGWIKKF